MPREKFKILVDPECEQAFMELKQYLSRPPVLSKPQEGLPLQLYVTVTEHTLSSVLVQERDGVQRPIYFISRLLHGVEKKYPTLEKVALTIVITARKIRPYFQSFSISVKTNLPVKQVLKRLDMTSRLVKWAMELAEYEIN